MAEFEDFEIINETNFSKEPTFELIDADGKVVKDVEPPTPSTPETVLPLLIPQPIFEKTSAVVEKQIVNPIENSPKESEELFSPVIPITTTTTATTFVSIKPIITQLQPTRQVIPPVPSLPPARPLQRYGDAALIPHNLDMTLDVKTIIDNAKKTRQNTLIASSEYKQQKQDIQTQSISEDKMATGSAFSNVLKAKEDLQKSPEQLEQEKRSILAQRVPPLQLDGKTKEDLIEKAKQFHNVLQQLHGAIYELTERFERQKYDMVELTERARQIEKGKAKTRKSNIVHTGLGGGIFNGVNDFTVKAPPKVSLFSRYERVTDRRTFMDRRGVWAEEKKPANFVPERPKAKIKKVSESSEETVPRRTQRAPTRQKTEEELPPPPAEDEEQAAAEEAPAEEESAPAEEEPAPAEEEPAAEEEEEEEEEE